MEYIDDGRYAVRITLDELGVYVASVSLDTQRLPFYQTIVGACREGRYARDWIPDCVACPDDVVDCDKSRGYFGATLQSLYLKPNQWRLGPNTSDIYSCNVRIGWSPGDRTPCKGGDNVSDYCHEGLGGPLCRVCVEADHFFDRTLRRCVQCPIVGAWALMLPVFVIICVVVILILLYEHWRMLRAMATTERGRRWVDSIERSWLVIAQLGLVAKAKICLAYFQVVLVMPEAFSVPLPPEYYDCGRCTHRHSRQA